jgi:3-methyladenine DNA glycosylase AlkD
MNTLVAELRRRLQEAAEPETKVWFETYMKHQECFIGVKTKLLTTIVKELFHQVPVIQKQQLWPQLLAQPYSEEKLAGIILYDKYLVPFSCDTYQKDLIIIEGLVADGHIKWWNTSDWICLRVLGRILGFVGQTNKGAAYKAASWCNSDLLWLKRMALVAFVNHAKKGDALFFGAQDLVLQTASTLIKSSERFHQTAVGWVLREVYKGNATVAEQFIITHYISFSREGLRYAIEKMPQERRKQFLAGTIG